MAQPRRGDAAARGVPRPKKPRWLIALGAIALACFVVVTLPAGVVAGRLTPFQLSAAGYSGTVWSGTAEGLTWRGTPMGNLRWHVLPREFLRARLAADVWLSRPDGSLSGRAAATLGGTLLLSDVQCDLPLDTFSGGLAGLTRGWSGRARGVLQEIRVESGWPTTVRGTVDVVDLVSPAPRNTRFGSYHAILPDPEASTASAITARVTDNGAPLSVDARLTVTKDRNFLLDGTLAPRADTPKGLADAVAVLGPPDAQGRRPFSVSGTL